MADEKLDPIRRGRAGDITLKDTDANGDPIDWIAGTLTAQLRPDEDSTILLMTFTVDDTNRAAGNGGSVVLSWTDEASAAITAGHSTAVFDVKADNSGDVRTAFGPLEIEIHGKVTA